MRRRRTRASLRMIVDAVGAPEADPAVRRLADAFGGGPARVFDQLVGEPGYRARHLHFASGGEIVVHDDAVVAVIMHAAPVREFETGTTRATQLLGIRPDATLDDIAKALAATPSWTGITSREFTLGGAAVSCTFANKHVDGTGNLLRLTVTVANVVTRHSLTSETCPTCSPLLTRRGGEGSGVAVDETIAALTPALTAGLLTEADDRVALADLIPLHSSGLMTRVESQLTCTTCHRVMCLILFRTGAAVFEYVTVGAARRNPGEEIPPVEKWGEAARIAAEREAMHLVDYLTGGWFLLKQHGELYLDARYSYSGVIDQSALIRLDDSERDAYRAGGADYISELATRIHNSAPFSDTSPYCARDLYRSAEHKAYSTAVRRATANVTWIAQQREKAP